MLRWIEDLINSLGYIGIALLMFLENIFPPIPSELIMPLAGFTASRGELSLIGIVIAGTLGSVIGQLPLYYLGRLAGEERLKQWADKYGKWLTVSSDDIDKAKDWFERHGSKAVFFARLVPTVRSLVSIPAGFAGMNLLTFLAYSTLGMGIWAGVLAYLGYILGENYELVEQYMSIITYIVGGVLAVLIIGWIVKRKHQQGAHPQHSEE
jgi:membrane protein DedA with SNARE-associated domain